MKYSEAIRVGCALGPQGFGDYGRKGELCANQAAMAALNVEHYSEIPNSKVYAACPVCGFRDELAGIVADCLNDNHRWTRERIADWIEGVESNLASEQSEGGQGPNQNSPRRTET